MKKLEISTELRNEILLKHKNGISMRKLEKEYPYSFAFIQTLINSSELEEKLKTNYPQKEGYLIFAVCKKTKKEFIDYCNDSGIITKHLFKTYPNEIKGSKYTRKSKEYETGKFWFDKYFTFEYRLIRVRETKKCFYCDWTTHDLDNKAGTYQRHLQNVHNKTIYDYLRDNFEDMFYFKNM